MKLKDDFSNLEQFEIKIKDKGFFSLWEQFQENGSKGFTYQDLANWQQKFKPFGLTFDYYLDAETFNFKIN